MLPFYDVYLKMVHDAQTHHEFFQVPVKDPIFSLIFFQGSVKDPMFSFFQGPVKIKFSVLFFP